MFVGHNLTNYIDEPFLLTLINNVPADVKNKADLAVVNQNSIRDLKSIQFSKDIAIIGIIDHFRASTYIDYSYWGNNDTSLYSQVITDIATTYPRTEFIIFISQESVSETLPPNVTIIRAGGQLTDSRQLFVSTDPVLIKNSKIEKPVISLNRQMRSHRIALISLLYGMELDDQIHITALKLPLQIKKGTDDFLEHSSWMFEEHHEEVKEHMINGFKRFYNSQLNQTDFDCYKRIKGTESVLKFADASNFKNNLSNLYANSLVEIITETSFVEPDIMITEKYRNSVLGCNFPILLAPRGAVQHLREVGFDMFDDVVDHSYDTIDNPIDRMYCAIQSNKSLITNVTIELWNSNKQRFVNNVEFAKAGMYNFYESRFDKELNHAL